MVGDPYPLNQRVKAALKRMWRHFASFPLPGPLLLKDDTALYVNMGFKELPGVYRGVTSDGSYAVRVTWPNGVEAMWAVDARNIRLANPRQNPSLYDY